MNAISVLLKAHLVRSEVTSRLTSCLTKAAAANKNRSH